MKPLTARRGFTLVELLVVVTIVGLLAALLFPVFVKVREGGRRTACLSNERQLGLGIIQYTADNDGSFPNDQTPGTAGQWAAQVYPQVKAAQVYRCPDDPTTDTRSGSGFHYYVDSYAVNLSLLENVAFKNGGISEVKPSVSETPLAAPAKTVLLFEVRGAAAALAPTDNAHLGCAASGNGSRNPSERGFPLADGCYPKAKVIVFGATYATGEIGGRPSGSDSPKSDGIQTDEPRHAGGANYLACDGHVAWLRPSSVSGGQSQPVGGENCGQDDAGPLCGGSNMAAGTMNGKYNLTFSVR